MDADLLYGLKAEDLNRLTGTHLTTCRRWLRTKRLPPTVSKLLAVLIGGDLEVMDPAWRGWRLVRGQIVSPEKWSFGPGDVLSLPFHRQLAMNYQQRLRTSLQVDWVEQRYVTPDEMRALDPVPRSPNADHVEPPTPLRRAQPAPLTGLHTKEQPQHETDSSRIDRTPSKRLRTPAGR